MNDFLSLAQEIQKIKRKGERRRIPIELREKILSKVQISDMPVEEVSKILKLNPATLLRWQQTKNPITPYKKKKINKTLKDNFIEILPSVKPRAHQLFLELELGSGSVLRIFR